MSVFVFTGLLAAALYAPQGEVQPRYPAEVETEASRIFNTTMSPYCPGLLIANCPSPGAARLKEEIRADLAAGISPDSVRAQLFAEYGAQIHATPPARGFGLLAWVLPAVALVGGGAGVFWWLRRRGAPAAPEAEAAVLDPASEARLAEELAKL